MSAVLTRQRPADGVLLLTINRPEMHNAISLEVQREIDRAVVDSAADPEVRAIVLAGAGEKAFTAGYDIAELTALSQDEHTIAQLEREELLWRWYTAAVPTICACRGISYGAGSLFAVSSDLRVGGPATKFKVTATAYHAANLTWVLDQLVGAGNARDILYTARVVEGPEAARLGLLNRYVPDEDVLDTSIDLATMIAANDRTAVTEVKRLLLAGPGSNTRARYDAENTAMLTTLAPRPMTDVFSAFLARKGSHETSQGPAIPPYPQESGDSRDYSDRVGGRTSRRQG